MQFVILVVRADGCYGRYVVYWDRCAVLHSDPNSFPCLSRATSLTLSAVFLLRGPRTRLHSALQAISLRLRRIVSPSVVGQFLLSWPCVPQRKHSPEHIAAVPGLSGYGVCSEIHVTVPCVAVHAASWLMYAFWPSSSER